jgi:hypothetical protein
MSLDETSAPASFLSYLAGVRRLGAVDEIEGSRILTRWFCLLSIPLVPIGSVAVVDGVGAFDVPIDPRSVFRTRWHTWPLAALLVGGAGLYFGWAYLWVAFWIVPVVVFAAPAFLSGRAITLSFGVVMALAALGAAMSRPRGPREPEDEALRRRVFKELTGHTLDPLLVGIDHPLMAELDAAIESARAVDSTYRNANPPCGREAWAAELLRARLLADRPRENEALRRLARLDPCLAETAGRTPSPLLPPAPRALPRRHDPPTCGSSGRRSCAW